MHCDPEEFRAYCRLTETGAGPSDARIVAAASHCTGVFLSCAWCLELWRTLEDPHCIRRRRDHDHAVSCSSAPQQLYLHCRIANITLLPPRLSCSEPGVRMLIPARAAAMRLTALFVGLLAYQAIRTPNTLNEPTHYTRSRPCVLETPQYDIWHDFNRVHALFLPNWIPTPTKILPKSSYLTIQGTFPWSSFVDSDILGMLNAPLPPQPLELDFQTLEIYFQKSLYFTSRGKFPWSAFSSDLSTTRT